VGCDGNGGVDAMKNDIIAKLKNSGRILIVDEPESLSVSALNLIRRIYDKANIGILFIGLPRFMENLKVRQTDYAYLWSRVGFRVSLDNLRAGDVTAIVTSVLPGANGTCKTFHEESGGNGRILSNLLIRCLRLSGINGTAVSPEMVREAAQMLAR
jgi:DNA transposition AAA+ family ATPase